MTSDTAMIESMYRVLVEEINRTRPELLNDGFTVAEIYQNLVPYRTHRDRIGADMNGDYEHALLRLLAGEGGYVKLESEVARRRLQEELRSVHPDTGIYRNFAACEVRLQPDRLEELGLSAEKPGEAAASAEVSSPPDSEEPVTPEKNGGGGTTEKSLSDVVVERAREPARRSDSDASEDGTCQWCREQLPEREDLLFCPFCGSRVDLHPCPECGAELESDWIFCIVCGAEAAG